MNCPHCKTALTPHEGVGTAKEGALHCTGCGCCFLADGKTPREGVPVCGRAPAPVVEAAPEEPEPVAAGGVEESEEKPEKPAARTRNRG